MKGKSFFRQFVAFLFVCSLLSPFAMASEDLSEERFITLERGATDEISAGEYKAVARFPVRLMDVRAESVELKTMDVLYGNRRESRLVMAFVPEMRDEPESLSQAISIEVDLNEVTGQGTYTIAVEAKTVDGRKRQVMDFQIIIPPAKLRFPGNIMVQQVVFPFGEVLKQSPFELEETSGRSRLSDIKVSYVPSSSGNRTIDGRIQFASLPSVLPPGGKEPVVYNVNGSFPLGITRGEVEITSPQLSEVLKVHYEVHRTVAKWIILVVIFSGLITGYLVRTGLKSQIELNGLRLKLLDLKERIIKEKQRCRDEDFQAALDKHLPDLEGSLKGKDVNAVSKSITDADNALSTAMKDLKNRRENAEKKLNEISKLVLMAKHLPDPFREILISVEVSLEEVRQEIITDNIKFADGRLESIRGDIAEKIRESLIQWRSSTRVYLQELSRSDNGLPERIISRLEESVKSLMDLLGTIEDVDPGATSDKISDIVTGIYKVRMNTDELMIQLRSWLQVTVAGVISILNQAGIKDRLSLEKLNQAIKDFSEKVAQGMFQSQKAEQDLPGQLQRLQKAWKDALMSQIPDAEKQEIDELKELITNGNYMDGARKVVQIIENIKTKKSREGKILGDGWVRNGVPPAFLPDLVSWSAQFAGDLTPFVITRYQKVEKIPEPLEVQRARTKTDLFRDTILQTLLVGILIAITGYLLFEENFVGTLQDFAGIFFWAFGIDFTVDALLGAVKGVSRKH